MLEDLNRETDEDIKEKLEAAVEEALDDETYRKVKRMSYQSHIADEVRTQNFTETINKYFTKISSYLQVLCNM